MQQALHLQYVRTKKFWMWSCSDGRLCRSTILLRRCLPASLAKIKIWQGRKSLPTLLPYHTTYYGGFSMVIYYQNGIQKSLLCSRHKRAIFRAATLVPKNIHRRNWWLLWVTYNKHPLRTMRSCTVNVTRHLALINKANIIYSCTRKRARSVMNSPRYITTRQQIGGALAFFNRYAIV